MTTLAAANRAISKAGIPLELVRGEGYHYFVYNGPVENVLVDTESVYVCYTNTYSAKEWVKEAACAMATITDNLRFWR
jgi:hypothetical protein